MWIRFYGPRCMSDSDGTRGYTRVESVLLSLSRAWAAWLKRGWSHCTLSHFGSETTGQKEVVVVDWIEAATQPNLSTFLSNHIKLIVCMNSPMSRSLFVWLSLRSGCMKIFQHNDELQVECTCLSRSWIQMVLRWRPSVIDLVRKRIVHTLYILTVNSRRALLFAVVIGGVKADASQLFTAFTSHTIHQTRGFFRIGHSPVLYWHASNTRWNFKLVSPSWGVLKNNPP